MPSIVASTALSVNVAVGLIKGEELSAGFAPHFRSIARTWPSVHQMLPVWRGCVQLKTRHGLTPASFDAMDLAVWPGASIDPAMLARARVTRTQFIDNPLSRMNGVKTRLLMSRAWPTASQLIVDGQTVKLAESTEPGDALVPADTTSAAATTAEQEIMRQFGSEGDTMKHFALTIDPYVSAAVDEFV